MPWVCTEHGDRVLVERIRNLPSIKPGPRAGGISVSTGEASKIDPDDNRIPGLKLSFNGGSGPSRFSDLGMANLGDNIGNGLVIHAISVAGSEAFVAIDVADKVDVGIAPRDIASADDGVAVIVGQVIEDPVLQIRCSGVDGNPSCDERRGECRSFTVEVLVLDREIWSQIQGSGERGRGERGDR